MKLATESFNHSLMITVFVFVMMMLVDYVNVLSRGKMSASVRGGLLRQYVITSFLGATPGCLGAFMNVSFYIHGLLSFGAMVGGMVATSGDEAFVMLALFPSKALLLFVILFLLGIILAFLADKIAPILKIVPCQECQLSVLHTEEECRCFDRKDILAHFRKLSLARFLLLTLLVVFIYGIVSGVIGPQKWNWKRITFIVLSSLAVFIVTTTPEHYLEEHIWTHIAKKHLWRIFLWSFFAIVAVDVALKYFPLKSFISAHMFWVLLVASLAAIIPESGPHFIFVMMFAERLIPFSVLLASSIIQDGHGMLPLLSYTVRDSVLIKLFNFAFGLIIGAILYFIGL